MNKIIPVIDLFAGPGGLGEGFSACRKGHGWPFKIGLSIEKDSIAHQTLLLRSFYRQFRGRFVPEEYYNYLRGSVSREDLYLQYANEYENARKEAWCAELGSRKFPHKLVDKRIKAALGRPKPKNWVLIGGPPCQAYSLVGRSRRKKDIEFENDPKHFLYKEYLRIIAKHKPPVFIMENVKGLLSATIKGENIFQKILSDLKTPAKAVTRKSKSRINISGKPQYQIYSLVKPADLTISHPSDYIVKSEEFGIPQARHRVILLGIRTDLDVKPDLARTSKKNVPMKNVLRDLPHLRSAMSKSPDSLELWQNAIGSITSSKWFREIDDNAFKKKIENTIKKIRQQKYSLGSEYYQCRIGPSCRSRWYYDPRLKGICNHVARSHMKEDLHRYFFAACFAKVHKRSPRIVDFPEGLWPKHANVQDAADGIMFSDRFRVQLSHRPSTTITSHISKDGHYFIHPEPAQCRSLTVREAARLQTFPDNYYFEGNRTAQYHQVGNAVPPLLAMQIAEIVQKIFKKSKK